MCIRDSAQIVSQRRGVARRQAHKLGQAHIAAHPLQARLSACLLYTSDAADERSSVDLGGRRIIKKKIKTYKDGPRSSVQKIIKDNALADTKQSTTENTR